MTLRTTPGRRKDALSHGIKLESRPRAVDCWFLHCRQESVFQERQWKRRVVEHPWRMLRSRISIWNGL